MARPPVSQGAGCVTCIRYRPAFSAAVLPSARRAENVGSRPSTTSKGPPLSNTSPLLNERLTPTPTPLKSPPSRAAAIAEKCRQCIHDPLAAGKWREQVAACASSNCPLFDLRPVPRHCIKNRTIDPAAVASLRARLEATDRARAAR